MIAVPARPRVCVAICTFRRPDELAALLRALEDLRFDVEPRPDLELLVIDNAPEGGAADVVAAHAPKGWPRRCIHVGAGNISVARNAVLDHTAGVDLVAMIDDDEVPAPRWLDQLLTVQRDTGADGVIGPVRPEFGPDAPGWVTRGSFFDLAEPEDRAVLDEGITGNALLVRSAVDRFGLRFDQSLGHAGGEDQHLFRTAVGRGAVLRYAALAAVTEPVPSARCTSRYLARRELRKGMTLGWLDRNAAREGALVRLPQRVGKAAVWAGRGAVIAATGSLLLDRTRVVDGLTQQVRALGMLAGLLGCRYDLYGRPPSAVRPRIAIVADEDPDLQAAGHSTFIRGFVRHYTEAGADVTVLVTGRRLGRVVRRGGQGVPALRSPSAWVLPAGIVVAKPRAALGQLAWVAFRAAPRGVQRAVDRARTTVRRRRGVDHLLGTPLDQETSQWLTDQLRSLQPEGVLFWTVFGVPEPLDLPESVRSAHIVTVDIMSQRAEAFRSLGYRILPEGFDRAAEAELLRATPGLVAIQWDDADALREMAPDAEISVVPACIEAPGGRPYQPTDGRCLFVGSGALHNVDGIRWFLDHCWPLVRDRSPDAELHIVGTVCARVGSVPPGVVLRGEVDDLGEEYRTAAVAVVPLRAGSGLKVKLVEALVHGVPVATTSVGAQGLLAVEPAPYALADEAMDLADAVHRLLDDPVERRTILDAASVVAERFSPAVAFRELDERFRSDGVRLPRPAHAPAPRVVDACEGGWSPSKRAG